MAKTTTNNINLNISDKTRYTINNNPDKYIELNPGDMGITARLSAVIPKLNKLIEEYDKLALNADSETATDDDMLSFNEAYNNIDLQLREAVNYLFDYDICSVCASGGSMMDLYDGEFRFSVIINTLIQMYEDTISEEMEKMSKKINKHTAKYTTQDHQKKKR